MAYTIDFHEDAHRDLGKLDPQVARRIVRFLHQRVSRLDDPRSIGDPLVGPRLGGLWRYRVRDWRVIVEVDDHLWLVLVLVLGHRRSIIVARNQQLRHHVDSLR